MDIGRNNKIMRVAISICILLVSICVGFIYLRDWADYFAKYTGYMTAIVVIPLLGILGGVIMEVIIYQIVIGLKQKDKASLKEVILMYKAKKWKNVVIATIGIYIPIIVFLILGSIWGLN